MAIRPKSAGGGGGGQSTVWRDSESLPPNTVFLDLLQILIEEMNCKKIVWEYSRHFEYERGSDDTENL